MLHGPGRYLYVSNQVGDDLTAYRVHTTTGALSPIATVPTGTQPIDLAFDATGWFLYAANSTSHEVSIYRIDPLTRTPVVIGGAAPLATGAFNVAFY